MEGEQAPLCSYSIISSGVTLLKLLKRKFTLFIGTVGIVPWRQEDKIKGLWKQKLVLMEKAWIYNVNEDVACLKTNEDLRVPALVSFHVRV